MAVHTLWTANGGWHPTERHVTSQHPGNESRDPVAVLRRIAFLLERQLADSYRIKAYRAAASSLLQVPEDEVRERHAAGTLRALPGIGAKTAGIVAECLDGRVPTYLTELEATAGPLAEGGAWHRAALRGDLHSHSDWSDGAPRSRRWR